MDIEDTLWVKQTLTEYLLSSQAYADDCPDATKNEQGTKRNG